MDNFSIIKSNLSEFLEILKAKRREEGEVWTQPSGRKVTKKNGKIIPVKGEGGKKPKEKPTKQSEPDSFYSNVGQDLIFGKYPKGMSDKDKEKLFGLSIKIGDLQHKKDKIEKTPKPSNIKTVGKVKEWERGKKLRLKTISEQISKLKKEGRDFKNSFSTKNPKQKEKLDIPKAIKSANKEKNSLSNESLRKNIIDIASHLIDGDADDDKLLQNYLKSFESNLTLPEYKNKLNSGEYDLAIKHYIEKDLEDQLQESKSLLERTKKLTNKTKQKQQIPAIEKNIMTLQDRLEKFNKSNDISWMDKWNAFPVIISATLGGNKQKSSLLTKIEILKSSLGI